jgi:hypothetical protein
MPDYEPLGYLASALVLTTFWMRAMLPLRAIAIASNVAFISYGLLADIRPVLLLHLLLLPLNLIRMVQSLREHWRRREPRAATFDTDVGSGRGGHGRSDVTLNAIRAPVSRRRARVRLRPSHTRAAAAGCRDETGGPACAVASPDHMQPRMTGGIRGAIWLALALHPLRDDDRGNAARSEPESGKTTFRE